MNLEYIVDHLNNYLKSGWMEKARKKNWEYANAIEQITKDDIFLGNQPVAFFGHVVGNSTAVGTKYEYDSESKYTISLDFNSDTCIFVDKRSGTILSTVRIAQKYFPDLRSYEVRYQSEAKDIATRVGKKFCNQSLNDLNYTLSEYRLNRYSLIENEPFVIPMRTINAEITYKNKKQHVHIGNWYIVDGKEYIDIYLSDAPLTTKIKLIITGIIAAIILILLLIIVL